MSHTPRRQGLYDPAFEHDACGVAFVVDIHGRREPRAWSRRASRRCATSTTGAPSGAEANTGDGAGILIQVPDRFLRAVVDFDLPPGGHYATGIAFLPPATPTADAGRRAIEKIVAERGPQRPRLARRADRRLDARRHGRATSCRRSASCSSPAGRRAARASTLERRAFVVRKRIEHEVGGHEADAEGSSTSRASRPGRSSTRACSPPRSCAEFYPDLRDERVESALALVHSRFSTNTFPSWPLAHPYRYIAHNGEINTVKGNRNWMRAREALLAVRRCSPGDLERIFPICTPGASRHGHASTRCSSCCTSAAAAAARRADDDPGGVGEPRRRWTRRSGPSTSSTPR